MSQVILWQFRKVSGSGEATKVESTYKAMKFRQSVPHGRSTFFDTTSPEFKSAKPEDRDPMGRMMAAMIDKPLIITIDSRGQITEIENLKPIRDALKDLGSGDTLSQATLESMITDDQLRSMFRQLFVVLPDEPVAVGSKWTTTTSFSLPIFGGLKSTSNWTYASDDTLGGHPVAHLKGVIATDFDPSAPQTAKQIPGAQVKIDSNQAKGECDVLFDTRTGLVQSSWMISTTPMSMTMSLPGANGQPGNTINMKMKGTTTYNTTVVTKDAPLDPDHLITRPDADAKQPAKPTAPSHAAPDPGPTK